MAEDLLVENSNMPSPTAADVLGISGKKPGSYRRLFGWSVDPDHFHFGMPGTVASALIFVAFAVTFALITLRNQKREEQRARSVEVMRLDSVVENDVSALENAYRGYLLTRQGDYMEGFAQLDANFLKHCDQLSSILEEDSAVQKRVRQMRRSVQSWFSDRLLSISSVSRLAGAETEIKVALKTPALDQAHNILQTILGEEQVRLRQAMGKRARAIQSIQILNFIPEMEQAVYGMQKEKRGYMLSGDPALIDSYNRATSDFYTFQGCLSVLVANDPAQVIQLKSIRDEIEKWIAKSAVPGIKAKGNGESLSGFAQVGRGDVLMDSVRHAMEQFEKAQYDIYQARLADAGRDAQYDSLRVRSFFPAGGWPDDHIRRLQFPSLPASVEKAGGC